MAGKIHRNSLKPGHKILWYEIKEVLGQGGFGITYLAYDPNLKKYVAIKEYLPIELAVREGDFSVHPVTEDRGKRCESFRANYIEIEGKCEAARAASDAEVIRLRAKK